MSSPHTFNLTHPLQAVPILRTCPGLQTVTARASALPSHVTLILRLTTASSQNTFSRKTFTRSTPCTGWRQDLVLGRNFQIGETAVHPTVLGPCIHQGRHWRDEAGSACLHLDVSADAEGLQESAQGSAEEAAIPCCQSPRAGGGIRSWTVGDHPSSVSGRFREGLPVPLDAGSLEKVSGTRFGSTLHVQ